MGRILSSHKWIYFYNTRSSENQLSCPWKNKSEAVTRDKASSVWLKLAPLCLYRAQSVSKNKSICDCAGARSQGDRSTLLSNLLLCLPSYILSPWALFSFGGRRETTRCPKSPRTLGTGLTKFCTTTKLDHARSEFKIDNHSAFELTFHNQ